MIFFGDKSKIFWYKDGDLNTKYFHASATARKKVNKIISLENISLQMDVCSNSDEPNVLENISLSYSKRRQAYVV